MHRNRSKGGASRPNVRCTGVREVGWDGEKALNHGLRDSRSLPSFLEQTGKDVAEKRDSTSAKKLLEIVLKPLDPQCTQKREQA